MWFLYIINCYSNRRAVSCTIANVPTPEFQKLWSNLIEFMRLEYDITQYPDVDTAMEPVRGVFITVCLEECTLASVSESLKWTLIVQTAYTRRNLHQPLKGKQLYSALYGVYTEVLHDLTAVPQESTAKGETAKTTITEPLSDE